MNIRLDNTHFLFLAYSGKVLNIKYLSVTANGGIFCTTVGEQVAHAKYHFMFPLFLALLASKRFSELGPPIKITEKLMSQS